MREDKKFANDLRTRSFLKLQVSRQSQVFRSTIQGRAVSQHMHKHTLSRQCQKDRAFSPVQPSPLLCCIQFRKFRESATPLFTCFPGPLPQAHSGKQKHILKWPFWGLAQTIVCTHKNISITTQCLQSGYLLLSAVALKADLAQAIQGENVLHGQHAPQVFLNIGYRVSGCCIFNIGGHSG